VTVFCILEVPLNRDIGIQQKPASLPRFSRAQCGSIGTFNDGARAKTWRSRDLWRAYQKAFERHTIFEHAWKLGHEGIIAELKDLPCESVRCNLWLNIRNPDSVKMKRYDDGTF
jgi:hypothetical protein